MPLSPRITLMPMNLVLSQSTLSRSSVCNKQSDLVVAFPLKSSRTFSPNVTKHNNTLELLTKFHRKNFKELLGNAEMQHEHHLVWVGDSKRHHPCWDMMDNNSLFTKDALEKAEILIQAIADIGLDLALPMGTPTHEHSVTKWWSRLDQVFATKHTIEALAQCEALPME